MNSAPHGSPASRLPVTGDLSLIYALSLVVAALMVTASGAGLLYADQLYSTDEARHLYLVNDVVTLIVGVPILLGSMALARRGSLIGLLFWPGALLYVVYNAVAYVCGLPLNAAFLLSLVLLVLSLYTLPGLVASIDAKSVQRRLRGAVSEGVTATALIVMGAAYLLLALGTMLQALIGRADVPAELPVMVADTLTAPAWVAGGILLLRRKPLGYAVGGGLLFSINTLFVGVIAITLLQPALTDKPFVVGDTLALAAMAIVAFIPTWLFARGVGFKA